MLTAHHIHKSFGIQPVLEDVSLNISRGDRLGLIGPNGCGKTTLMRILAGLEAPDSGSVIATRPGLRIGYLAQGMTFEARQTLAEALTPDSPSQADPQVELSALADALTQTPGDPVLQSRYDDVLGRIRARADAVPALLAPLGLAEVPFETPVAHLSGGQKTRLMLARVLMQEPHLLLLDEPTNHLDIGMLEWLEAWLARFQGAALIVSHDRAFLDQSVESILELDPASHALKAYAGNYADYLEQKSAEREKQAQAWQDQQDEIAQLRAAAAHIRKLTRKRKGGKGDSGDKFAAGFFGNRATKNVAGRATHIEARIEKLLNEERIEKPKATWRIKLDFGAPQHQSREVLQAENLSIGYDTPLLDNLNLAIRAGQRIALSGPNGSGKSTLIRTIAGLLSPLAGTLKLGATVKIGYMAQEQESLDPALNALGAIQQALPLNETEARNFLHFFLFKGDDALRPAGTLSFGERARLQLGRLVAQGCTFLLLDEPINHLDIPSRARFEEALSGFKGTILAVVHDRYFIDRFATDTWLLQGGRLEKHW